MRSSGTHGPWLHDTFQHNLAPIDCLPRYVCFVCPPTENFPDFALVANTFCRTLDEDPYVDAIWGILTGFDFSKVVVPGETIIWDAGKGLKVGDERSVTFTARRVRD